MARLTLWGGVLFGVALRLYHYLRCPSVWQDEAAIMVNIIRKDFADLVGPLTHTQAAPPLFLWLERLTVLGLGDGEYALRFWPMFFGCLTLVIFALLARRLLGAFAPWAVVLLATSDRLLSHGAECKPYSIDVFAAVAVTWVYVRSPQRPTLISALLFPVLMSLSYGSCFVIGGVMLAWLTAIVREQNRAGIAAYALTAFAVVITFLLLYLGPIHAQRNTGLTAFWVGYFPDWDRPLMVPAWAVGSLFEIARYDVLPVGAFFVPLSAIGAVHWARHGRAGVAAVLLMPILAAFVGACFRAYPFAGGRLLVFTTPALVLLTVAGFAPSWRWLRHQRRPLAWALPALLLIPVGLALFRVIEPWPRPASDEAAAFVLRHREEGTPVAHNHWDYDYHFRDAPGEIRYWHGPELPEWPRYWVVITAGTAEDREGLLGLATGTGRVIRREEFEETVVGLVERPPASGPPSR